MVGRSHHSFRIFVSTLFNQINLVLIVDFSSTNRKYMFYSGLYATNLKRYCVFLYSYIFYCTKRKTSLSNQVQRAQWNTQQCTWKLKSRKLNWSARIVRFKGNTCYTEGGNSMRSPWKKYLKVGFTRSICTAKYCLSWNTGLGYDIYLIFLYFIPCMAFRSLWQD